MQLDYGYSPAKGYPGMIYDSGVERYVVSRVNPSVVIPFGTLVSKGTDDDHIKLPTTAAEVTAGLGIALQDWAMEQTSTTLPSHPIKSAVPVMRRGRVWVTVEEAVVANDPCYVRWADGNGGKVQKGAFRKSVDQVASADTATLLPGARYMTSASAGELAVVEINLP